MRKGFGIGMFENSIFKNPAGWAGMVAGTRGRYIFTSLVSVVTGLSVFFVMVLSLNNVWIRLITGICIFAVAIELPLYSLRALRTLLKEKEERSRHPREA